MEERIWHQHYDYNVLTSYRFPRIPVQALLDIPCNSFPDKPAINYYGSEISFWELREWLFDWPMLFLNWVSKKEIG